MKNLLRSTAFLALVITLPLPAHAVSAIELHVSQEGDLEMSCGTLSQEASLMREIITTTQDIKSTSKVRSRGVGVASAVGSFLIGSATAGIGFAAAGYLFNHTTEDKVQDVDHIQDIAQQRRSLMVGIFNAKGCEGPIEHVMQDNLPTPDPAFELARIETAAGDETPETTSATPKPSYNQ